MTVEVLPLPEVGFSFFKPIVKVFPTTLFEKCAVHPLE